MGPNKVLVLYYSRSGHTRRLAERIALALGADLEPITDQRPRSGLIGYLRSGFEATTGRLATIAPITRDLAAYDLVVIGSPVWNAAVSSPIRAFLTTACSRIKQTAFFCTYGGRGAERAFEQMASVAGRLPVATLAVKEAELERADMPTRIAQFAGRLPVVGTPATV
jgi:flavodoxin